MTDQVPAWLIYLIDAYGIVACVSYLLFGVAVYIDREFGFPHFREWFAHKFWRWLFTWPLHPLVLVDLLIGAALAPLVYSFLLWRWKPRKRCPASHPEGL